MSLSKILSIATLTAAAALTPVTAHAADHTTAPAAGSVQVVKSGQLVDAGHGVYLKLTHSQKCVGDPELWNCKSVVDGNQPKGTVGLQTQGDATGSLYTPLYIGDGRAARMTVTTDGVTYDVQVVTLAGHPGYATGYVWGAAQSEPPTDPSDIPDVTVYDASGTVLAQL